ncbi:MAG: putative quinol monooxygenase [Deinococcota bacterium]
MVMIQVKIELVPEQQRAFQDYVQQEALEVSRYAGCLSFELFQDVNVPTHFLLHEVWQDKASFENYRTSDLFQASQKQLTPMLAARPDSLYIDGEVFN